jgi:O-antigen/teichoic acid export membrane protein
VLVARLLGPGGFGVLSIALAIAFTVSGLSDWGMSVAFTRLASPEVMAGRPIRHLHTIFLLLRVGIGAALAAAVALAGPWLLPSLQLPPEYPWLAAAGAAAGLALGVGAHYGTVLQVLRDQRGLALIRTGAALMRLAAYVTVAALAPTPLTAVLAVGLLAIPIESALMAVRAHRRIALWPLVRQRPPRAWLEFSLWAALPAIAYNLIGQTDTILMAALAGTAETGRWAAAARVGGVLLMGSGAVWSVALPYATAITDRAQLARYFRLVRYGAAALAVVVAPAIVLAPWIIRLLFGEGYADSVQALRFLLAANALGSLALVLVPVAYRLRRERLVALVGGAQFAVNLVGDALLIPRYGATGCAAATFAMQLAALTILAWPVLSDLERGGELPPAAMAH